MQNMQERFEMKTSILQAAAIIVILLSLIAIIKHNANEIDDFEIGYSHDRL
jgi:hypothetical protein